MTNQGKRIISLILAFILTVLSVNTDVFAASTTADTGFKFEDRTYELFLERGSDSKSLTIKDSDNKTISNSQFTWVSSDSSIVDCSNGTVTAKRLGKAIITATKGDKSDSCIVYVQKNSNEAPSITINGTQYDIVKGETETVNFDFKGYNVASASATATDSDIVGVILESFDLSTGKGSVTFTGKQNGTTSITVSLLDKTGSPLTVINNTINVSVTTPVESISLNPSTLTITEGDEREISVDVLPNSATYSEIEWICEDPGISITPNPSDPNTAKVTAAITNTSKAGFDKRIFTITAKCGGKETQCSVTVLPHSNQYVSHIDLNQDSVMLYNLNNDPQKQFKFEATVFPTSASTNTVSWEMETTSVASLSTVDPGTVDAGSTTGYAIITATANDDKKAKAYCVVTNSNAELGVISVPIDYCISGFTNETQTVKIPLSADATILSAAEIMTNTIASFSDAVSSDNIITENGEKYFQFSIKCGNTRGITAMHLQVSKAADGSSSVMIHDVFIPIIVKEHVSEIKLNSDFIVLDEGKEAELSYNITPATASNKKVTWSVETGKEDIISCSNGVVTGLKPGLASVTVTTDDTVDGQAKTATAKVLVVNRTSDDFKSQEINLKSKDAASGNSDTINLTKGTDFAWEIITAPDSDVASAEISGGKDITVSSNTSNESSTVAKLGYYFTDPATSSNEKHLIAEKEVLINVAKTEVDVSSISISGPPSYIMRTGDIVKLDATILPNNATDKNLSWVSDTPSVAKVTNGSVYAVAPGNAVIHAEITTGSGTPVASNNINVTVSDDISILQAKQQYITINVGESYNIYDNNVLSDRKDSTVSIQYTSDKTDIAGTNSAGLLTGKAVGTATITVSALGSKLLDTFTVNVVLDYGEIEEQDRSGLNDKIPEGVWFRPLPLENKQYTGDPVTQTIRVYDGNKKLTYGTDYDLEYTQNNINVGKVTMTIVGKGNYLNKITGKSGEFYINPKPLTDSNVTLRQTNYEYTGNPITPEVIVTDGNKTLRESDDYTVGLSNNTNKGTARVTVTGKGNYSGTVSKTFTIKAKEDEKPVDPDEDDPPIEHKGLWIKKIEDQIYTGAAIKPAVQVYYDDFKLIQGTDYTVSYKNNIKAYTAKKGDDNYSRDKAPSAVIKLKGIYSGTETETFVINRKSINASDISINYTDVYACPKKGNPALKLTVKHGSKTLKNNTDYYYEITNSSGKNVVKWSDTGSYNIVIYGAGNYKDTRTCQFEVTSKLLFTKATVSAIKNQKYTGRHIQPEVTVKYGGKILKEFEDYVVFYENDIEIGTATAVIKGKGIYAGTVRKTYKITGDPITKAKINDFISAYVYTGTSLEQPDAYLTYNKVKLRENEDYIVSYFNNVNKGVATVYYTGIHGFSGTLKKTYRINAFNLKKNDINDRIYVKLDNDTVSLKNESGKAKVHVYDRINGRYSLLREGVDYTLSYSNNKKIGNTASLTIKGKGNYTGAYPRNYYYLISP